MEGEILQLVFITIGRFELARRAGEPSVSRRLDREDGSERPLLPRRHTGAVKTAHVRPHAGRTIRIRENEREAFVRVGDLLDQGIGLKDAKEGLNERLLVLRLEIASVGEAGGTSGDEAVGETGD